MNKLLCALLLTLAATTARADVVTTIILPQVVSNAIEKLAEVFDGIRTVAEPENKDWAKYTNMRTNMISTMYSSGRKVALTSFRACTGEDPSNEMIESCSAKYSESLQSLKQSQKAQFKELQAENRKHREYLMKKRALWSQVDEILE